MWIYSQSTGKLWDDANKLVSTGYSGCGDGKNCVAAQSIPNVGPIPQGGYDIGEAFYSEHSGPVCMRLTPREGTNTFGRSDFEIHGDSFEHPGQASHGCIILDRSTRLKIAASSDRTLYVQA